MPDLSDCYLYVKPEVTGERWDRSIIAHLTVGGIALCGYDGDEQWDGHITQVRVCEKCRAELKKQGG